jgi:hypothetical protein
MYIPGPYYAEPGFVLECDTAQSGVAAFLMNNPFIAEQDGKLIGVIFQRNRKPLAEDQVLWLSVEYGYPGLAELRVYGLGEEGDSMLLHVQPVRSQPAAME